MTLKYRYFYGGDYNPFLKERDTAYSTLTEEARLADPDGMRPTELLLPKMDSWPDFVIAESKCTFWKMERDIHNGGEDAADRIENFWKEMLSTGGLGSWLKEVEADETEKALALYMATRFRQFNPTDRTVDFRLYFTESKDGISLEESEEFSLNPYEG